MVSADSPQQLVQDQAAAQLELKAHQQAKTDAQANAQGVMPQPDWKRTPSDATPVSSLGALAATGAQAGAGSGQQAPLDVGLQAQQWPAARVVPEGMVLLPGVGEIGAPLLQTPTQLPVFGLDSVLWPNQLMMLR